MASKSSISTMELDHEVTMFSKAVVGQQERRVVRPAAEQAVKCPRCDSSNTKFCYYNNYSLSQPRYFCKGCRRYWTQGGTLRNVPVGGGCRKNTKRSSSSSSNSSKRSSSSLDHLHHPLSSLTTTHNNNVLNTLINISSFSPTTTTTTTTTTSFDHYKQNPSCAIQLGLDHHHHHHQDHCDFLANPTPTPNAAAAAATAAATTNNNNMMSGSATTTGPFLDALRGGSYLDNYHNIGLHHHHFHNFNNYGLIGSEDQVGDHGGEGHEVVGLFPYEEGKGRAVVANNIGENGRGFWNFPWHIGGGGGGGGGGDHQLHHHQGSSISGVDSGRDCWTNGIGSSNWHNGLINSPLM